MSVKKTMDGVSLEDKEKTKRYMTVSALEAMEREIKRTATIYKGLEVEELEWDFGRGPQVGMVRVPFEKTVLPDGVTLNPIFHTESGYGAWDAVRQAFDEHWKEDLK